MMLVLTLLCRDEADILESMLRFHLAQGVDRIIATDNGSVDGSLEILQRFERRGQLTLLQVRVITIKMEMMRIIMMIIVIKVLMMIAQVSTASGQVIIFDLQTTPAIMSQGGLQRLLQAEHIIKVRDIRNNFCISFN